LGLGLGLRLGHLVLLLWLLLAVQYLKQGTDIGRLNHA